MDFPVKRFKLTFWDYLLAGALGAFAFEKGTIAILIAFIAFFLYLLIRSKFTDGMPGVFGSGNKFVVDDTSDEKLTVEVDVDFDRRPAVNHFRTNSRYLTHYSSADYEYRIDGTNVFCRLIEDRHEDAGVPEYQRVRDGVVLESAIRERNKDVKWDWFDVNDEINPAKKEVEWHEITPLSWHGLKYFILAKKLPRHDARRYLRQELERLQTGAAAFFKEAEKYGLERDDNSRLIDRLKVAEGKTQPPDNDIQNLFASAQNFGITDLEFSWERKLTGVLQKLLGEL